MGGRGQGAHPLRRPVRRRVEGIGPVGWVDPRRGPWEPPAAAMFHRSRRSIRSISVPIVMASIAVALSIALLVGWTFLLARRLTIQESAAFDVGLLVAGVVSFLLIIGTLITFAVFLAREILEVRQQDGFIDSVTHELRSPLASIKLCLQTLGRPGVDPDKREQLRVMSLDDVERLSSFIDDVIAASRLAHARVGMQDAPVDVPELLERIVAQVAGRHGAQDHVQVDAEPGLIVRTDLTAIETVMRNLVDNALKYSGDPPAVMVRARRSGASRVVIEVEDRGIGIAKRHLRRVFHRFYRVPGEAVRQRKGTGLGLFVVSALVRNLGGRVEATSAGEGTGTTMRVVLPAGAEA